MGWSSLHVVEYSRVNDFLYSEGGSVAEWLRRRTCNSEVTGSSPALTT